MAPESRSKAVTDHISSLDKIKVHQEDTKDCAVLSEEDGSLNSEDYWKPTHRHQCLLEYKLGVIRIVQHQAENIPSKPEGKEKAHTDVKEALKICGFPNWAFTKSASGTN